MIKKRVSLLLVICTIFSILTGCSSAPQNQNVVTEVVRNGDYILTTENGIVTMFDDLSNVVSEVDLNGGEESEYIYAMDEGNLYSSQCSVSAGSYKVFNSASLI